MSADPLKVLIVAENASVTFGGEGILALHYFRRLRNRGIDARLLVQARNREPLLALLPEESDRICFAPDSLLHRLIARGGGWLPVTGRRLIILPAMKLLSQFYFRAITRRIIREHGIDVVHQPAPVSPKDLCLLFGFGVPVVIGPLNGGMSYPPGFKNFEGRASAVFVSVGRALSNALHQIFPGKLRADLVLVANDRTRRALPHGVRGRIVQLTENGVDLTIWRPRPKGDKAAPIRFVYSGRLVAWKGIDCLLHAFARVAGELPARLDIYGDGGERVALQRLTSELGLEKTVTFYGWVAQHQIASSLAAADIFILPSLHECGGAVVLEAMAAGTAVIATRWGGPTDYLDETCGVLVDPANPADFVKNLAEAMKGLAREPERRKQLADLALQRVRTRFDWERKIDDILLLYRRARSYHAKPGADETPRRDVVETLETLSEAQASGG